MKTLLLAYLSTLFIIDVETSEPLVGVEVISQQTGKSYYTDIDGMVNIPTDSCEYYLRYISYSDTLICGQDTLVKMKQL